MSTFVEISSDRLLTTLREIGTMITAKGGCYEQKTEGQEIVVSFALPPSQTRTEHIVIKVYTSIAQGADQARGCGEDAIRIVVGSITGGEFKPVRPSEIVKRTAPNNVQDREGVFLERFTGYVREAYRFGLGVPVCSCGRHMAFRPGSAHKGKEYSAFWGCTGYPSCKNTKKI